MNSRRFVVVADNHGDMEQPECVDALWQFMDDFQPVTLVHAGDNWDFRNLRRGASDDERAQSLEDDWKAGKKFLTRFFKGGEDKYFLRGNHDERMWDTVKTSSGVIRDYAIEGCAKIERLTDKLGVTMLPYDSELGILKLGHLSVIHGYHTGAAACRQHASIYRNCIFGHVHTIESAPVPSIEPAEARSIGCMCRRDMDYINKKTGKLRWANGWAYGVLFEDGTYQLFQTRGVNGRFYAATDFEVYGKTN